MTEAKMFRFLVELYQLLKKHKIDIECYGIFDEENHKFRFTDEVGTGVRTNITECLDSHSIKTFILSRDKRSNWCEERVS